MSQNRTEKLRMLPTDVNDHADEAARDVVFTFGAPRAIIVKINSKDTLGLPSASTTKEQIQRKLESHRETAAVFGIDGDAYRDRAGLVHTGKRVYENVSRIRLNRFIDALTAAGYKLVNASWFQKSAQPGKRQPDPTLSFAFSRDGEAIEMTEQVKTFFQDVYVDGMHLWCNPKMNADGTPYRLDTINGFAGQVPKNPKASPGTCLLWEGEAIARGNSVGYSFDKDL